VQVEQALLGHPCFQRVDRRIVEATQIAIDGVEAWNDPASEPNEQRVGRPALKPEDAILTEDGRVDEQAHLRLHGVDDQAAVLEACEPARQLCIDALLPEERSEMWEPSAARQARVAPASVNAPRVGPNDPLPPGAMSVASLAAKRVSAHLMDARRRRGLHVVVTASTTTMSPKFQAPERFAARLRGQHRRDAREIHVKSGRLVIRGRSSGGPLELLTPTPADRHVDCSPFHSGEATPEVPMVRNEVIDPSIANSLHFRRPTVILPVPTPAAQHQRVQSGVPDSQLTREATGLLREFSTPLLFNHSHRVFFWANEFGRQTGQRFDIELLFICAAFHDLGLLKKFSSERDRFEVDSANAVRQFLEHHHVPDTRIQTAWDAISLHTTPGIAAYKPIEVELLYNGVALDVLGIGYEAFPSAVREKVVAQYPREDFKARIAQAFLHSFEHKTQTAEGTCNEDICSHLIRNYRRSDFYEQIQSSPFQNT
jgi:hypothetical protein